MPAKFTLHALDRDPVVCTDASGLRLDLDGVSATVVDPPAAAPAMPLSAEVRQVDGHWSACLDNRCKAVGRRLATAIARAASDDPSAVAASFDLTTVVVADEMWNIAADRTVTLRPPEIHPSGPGKTISVIGDVFLVKWQGDCTDRMCLVSHLVDRNGRELGWVEAAGRVVRLDNDHFLAISEFAALQIRDLHRGTLVSEFDQFGYQEFRDIARLDDTTYALLRYVAAGVQVAVIDVAGGHLLVRSDRQMTLPACDEP